MATCVEIFEDDKTQNCIKCLYGMKLTRNAIVPLANDVMKRFRDDAKESAIKKNKLSESANCSSCSTKDVVPCGTWGLCRYQKGYCKYHDVPPKQCPNKLCDEMFSYIMKHHRYGKPSWKNTDASAWCSNEWEVAKCFCPTDGYSDSKSAEKTDLNGILSIIQNCEQFEMYFDDIKQVDEVRRFCRSLRHSPDMQVTSQEMSVIFKALTNLLTDGKWIGSKPEAISTVNELKKLETNKLSVSSEEVGKLLVLEKGAMEDCKDALNKERDADIVTLKDIVSRLDKVTQLLLVLDRQRPSKRSFKSDDGQLPKRLKRDRASYSFNVEGLLKDLCIFYDKFYSTLPLGPMFEEKVSKLEEVFVLPNLVQQRAETTNEKKRDDMFLSGREKFKVPIASVDEIFLRRHKQAKIVYIEGKAGFGKTSFCKFLIKLWCLKTGHASIVNKNETMFVDDQEYVNNSEILQNFKVLFYVPLRLVGVDIVNVDQMIFTHIIQNLENGDKYKKSFVQRILKEEKCLIILDGLDEWKHPSDRQSCMKVNCCIPHCNYQNCTLLIASRPWKIAESHITVSEEDNRIAIQKMSVDSQRKLIVKASNRLVKESYAVDVSKFLEQVERQCIQDFLSNPLAIVQLLCIYHDEKTLVDSRCKIYCQILNMLLGRAKQMFKMNQQNINDGSETFDLPTCFKQDADQCQEHKSILFRLGEVAYTALKSTSTQVLDESTVRSALRGEQEVSFILTAGLLSKDEQSGKLSKQVCRYSFFALIISRIVVLLVSGM